MTKTAHEFMFWVCVVGVALDALGWSIAQNVLKDHGTAQMFLLAGVAFLVGAYANKRAAE